MKKKKKSNESCLSSNELTCIMNGKTTSPKTPANLLSRNPRNSDNLLSSGSFSKICQWVVSLDRVNSKLCQWVVSLDILYKKLYQWVVSLDRINSKLCQWVVFLDRINSKLCQWVSPLIE